MEGIKKFPGGPRFPESEVDNTGLGPDFPGSSGDREKSKFRPSATPRLTQVAVTGDDGKPVTLTTNEILLEILAYQKGILTALSFIANGADFEAQDALKVN